MSQQRKIIRRQANLKNDSNKDSEKANFATIVMRVFIIVVLVAMLVGLAIQIIVY